MSSNLSRRELLRALGAAAGLGLGLACRPAASPAQPTTDGPPAASENLAGRPPPTAGRRDAGLLTYALAGEPDTLDPANALTLAAEAAGHPLYDGLVEFGLSFEPRPALAHRWVVSDDGLLYTFFLRSGVVFHDGTPFNARAAQNNFERLLGEPFREPGTGASSSSPQSEMPRRRELLAGIVRRVRAVEEFALELILERPFSPLLHHLAQFGAAMVSPQAHGKWNRDLGRHPVGTGPFRFVSWERGSRLKLEAWDQSWRGKPLLDRVVFRFAADEQRRLQLLEADQVQLGGAVSLDLLSRVQNDARLEVDLVPSARALGIAINTQAAPFNDRRVRQALNFAIDRAALVRSVYQGHALALGGALAPSVKGAAPLPPYPFDPAWAKRLLGEAAYPAGLESALLVSKGRGPDEVRLVQEVQKQLQEVGVRTRLELLDQAQYTSAVTRSIDETALRLSLAGWLPSSGEARGGLLPLFHSSQWMPKGFNSCFFRNERFDDLLERATRATQGAERDSLYGQAQDLLYEEAPWIFLIAPKTVVARSAALRDPFVTASEVVSVSEKTWLE